jgi:16S rRNA (uracil1498-N3)-methyltransferase
LNLFLIDQPVVELIWEATDKRTVHLRKVLLAGNGDLVDFGVINGPRGKGKVNWLKDGRVKLDFQWEKQHPNDLLPISLWVGLSRPQTCRKILVQAAALGVAELIFFDSDKGEPSYGRSSLWKEEWFELLIQGTEQAFACHLPSCQRVSGLDEALSVSSFHCQTRLALDVYEADGPLSPITEDTVGPVQLVIGSERGWSARERDWLRQNDFALNHLGDRVLRVETAMVAAVGMLASAYWSGGNERTE